MFSCLFQELHDTVVLVLKCDLTSGAPPLEHLGELRAVEADGSIELRCCSFAEPYNFEATGEDNMLVTSPITRRFRKLFFQCCELSQPGVLLVSGPAGTGKTETMKDAAAELGARSIIFNAAKFQEDVDFATEFQSGSSFAQHLDTCAHAPGATFFIFEEFLTLPLFAVTFILERQKLYRRQHLSTLARRHCHSDSHPNTQPLPHESTSNRCLALCRCASQQMWKKRGSLTRLAGLYSATWQYGPSLAKKLSLKRDSRACGSLSPT